MCYRCVLSCALLMLFLGSVSAQPKWTHGKRALMLEPPQRSSLWRFGNETPLNINDSALNCGGFEVSLQIKLGLNFRKSKLILALEVNNCMECS